MYIYVVYDEVSEQCNMPFCANTDSQAIMVCDEFYSKHSDTLRYGVKILRCVGVFNQFTGAVDKLPEGIVDVKEYEKREVKENG